MPAENLSNVKIGSTGRRFESQPNYGLITYLLLMGQDPYMSNFHGYTASSGFLQL